MSCSTYCTALFGGSSHILIRIFLNQIVHICLFESALLSSPLFLFVKISSSHRLKLVSLRSSCEDTDVGVVKFARNRIHKTYKRSLVLARNAFSSDKCVHLVSKTLINRLLQYYSATMSGNVWW